MRQNEKECLKKKKTEHSGKNRILGERGRHTRGRQGRGPRKAGDVPAPPGGVAEQLEVLAMQGEGTCFLHHQEK